MLLFHTGLYHAYWCYVTHIHTCMRTHLHAPPLSPPRPIRPKARMSDTCTHTHGTHAHPLLFPISIWTPAIWSQTYTYAHTPFIPQLENFFRNLITFARHGTVFDAVQGKHKHNTLWQTPVLGHLFRPKFLTK